MLILKVFFTNKRNKQIKNKNDKRKYVIDKDSELSFKVSLINLEDNNKRIDLKNKSTIALYYLNNNLLELHHYSKFLRKNLKELDSCSK